MVKYPERVYAVMKRKKVEGEIKLFRSETKILLGGTPDKQLLGTAFMTNPGSYKMTHHLNWNEFYQGLGLVEEISGESGPDPTMRNLIKVIRETYQEADKPPPTGYVAIYNISTLVESDGAKVAQLHNQAKAVLGEEDASLLQERDCYDFDLFHELCRGSKFIVLGFLKNVFPDEQQRIIEWCRPFSHKLVYSNAINGHFHHPYRWPLIPGAMEQVKLRLREAIQAGGYEHVPS